MNLKNKSVIAGSLAIAVIVCLFSSCLGDTKSSFETGKDFAFIKKTDDQITTFASTRSGGYITSEEIEALTPGKCYFLGYKIESSFGMKNGIQIAQVSSKSQAIQEAEIRQGPPANDPEFTSHQEVNVTELSLETGAAQSTFFGDNWWMDYKVKDENQKDSVAIYYYYDKDNQIDQDGKTKLDIRKDGKAIIDVRFAKINNTSKDFTGSSIRDIAANVNYLRLYLGAEEDAKIYFKFRYVTTDKNGKKTDTYLGSWQGAGENNFYIQQNPINSSPRRPSFHTSGGTLTER